MKIFKAAACLLIMLLFVSPQITVAAEDFNDIPKEHWAYSQIMQLKELGITSGIGDNNFGIGRTITRAEFVTFLYNLVGRTGDYYTDDNYLDNSDESKWYYHALKYAHGHNLTGAEKTNFRPGDNITREEMAVILINSMDIDYLLKKDFSKKIAFSDVTENISHITIAKDLGIISGTSTTTFSPGATATREQAAAMIMRMYNILQNKPDELNGFYAIRSSNQIKAISKLDTVSYGWCALETDGSDVWINTTNSGGNEYNIPEGFEHPWSEANNKKRLLMVAVKDEYSSLIMNDLKFRIKADRIIGDAIKLGLGENKISFDGVVLDFETLKGEKSRGMYAGFIRNFRLHLGPQKLLYIAVHPARYTQEYYDGYDFRELGKFSDKIILMAHDYNPKSLTEQEMAMGITTTPVAPIGDVYEALKSITDENTGVEDRERIMLQISFASCQWKLRDGKVINAKPYTPDYSAIASRIASGAEVHYSHEHQSPYITFYNEEDDTDNIVWYENKASVLEKMRLARLFGIEDFSFWRIGTIPDFPQADLDVYDGIFHN